MFLSDRDLLKAIQSGQLIVDPPPTTIDPTSIDLHLDTVERAKIWDTEKLKEHHDLSGGSRPEVRIGTYDYSKFSTHLLKIPPDYDEASGELVQKRVRQVVVRKGGFLLWQTKEKVGTPDDGAELICFVDGKSTRARAGILVHLTAPTIHSTWSGKITLEIVNLGPFDLVLQEGDVIAQLTVAKITSPPEKGMNLTSATYGQSGVEGIADRSIRGSRKSAKKRK